MQSQTPQTVKKFASFIIVLFTADVVLGQLPNPLNFNTAINAANTGTISTPGTDLNWSASLTNSLGPFVPCVTAPNPGWMNPPTPLAGWVTYPHTCSPSPAEHSCLGNIDVFYQLTFSLSPIVCGASVSSPGAYNMAMQFYGDNCISAIYVNGVLNYTTPVTPVASQYNYTGFQSGNGINIQLSNNWIPGTNTVLVKVASGAPSFPGWEGFLAMVTQSLTTVSPAVAITASVNQTNITCNGGSNGSASLTVLAGNGPFSYSWTPSGITTSVATNLSAGTYTYMVSGGGCKATSSVTITQPQALTLSISASSNTACVGNSVTLGANVSGGTAPYTYLWSGGPASPLYTVTKNSGGSYAFLVTANDQNNCPKTGIVSVTFFDLPKSNVTQTNVACFGGNNGSATLTTISGTGPFTYSWLPSNASSSVASGLPAGNYTVLVSGSGCASASVITITQPPAVTLNLTAGSSSACVGSSVTLVAGASGGVAPYAFLWNGGPASSSYVVSQSIVGSFIFTATTTDKNTCSKNGTVAVTFVELPNVLIAGAKSVCTGKTVTLSASGASTYSWSNLMSGATITVSPGTTTTYSVTGNTSGCTNSAAVTVTVSKCTGIEGPPADTEFRIFPNPSNGKIFVTASERIEKLDIIDGSGAIHAEFLCSGTDQIDLISLADGLYFIRCEFSNGSASLQKVVIAK
jgi:hypothetical protein